MTDILRVRERIRTWRSRSLPCRVGIPLHVGSVPRRIPRGRSSTIKGRKKRIYRKYLSELLVRHGYARIAGVTTPLPNTKVNEDDYIQLLQVAAKYARQNKQGIWARVKK